MRDSGRATGTDKCLEIINLVEAEWVPWDMRAFDGKLQPPSLEKLLVILDGISENFALGECNVSCCGAPVKRVEKKIMQIHFFCGNARYVADAAIHIFPSLTINSLRNFLYFRAASATQTQ